MNTVTFADSNLLGRELNNTLFHIKYLYHLMFI